MSPSSTSTSRPVLATRSSTCGRPVCAALTSCTSNWAAPTYSDTRWPASDRMGPRSWWRRSTAAWSAHSAFGAPTTCARPITHVRWASGPTAAWSSGGARRPSGSCPSPSASTCATPASWSRPRSRGTPSAWPPPVPESGSPSWARAHWGYWRWRAHGGWAPRRWRWRRGTPTSGKPANGWAPASVPRVPTTSSSKRPAPRRAWPAASSSWVHAASSRCWGSTWATSSSTGTRCSSTRPASSPRSATARTTVCASSRRRRPCWPTNPTSRAPSSPIASPLRTPARRSAWRPSAPAVPSAS